MTDLIVPLFLVVCGVAVLLVKDLMSSIMIFSVYSLMIAIEWCRLNAVDVAITEAAVGAGISTVLFLVILGRTKYVDEGKKRLNIPALLVAVGFAALLLYGTIDLPHLREGNIAPNTHVVTPYYLEHTYEEAGQLNAVAAILAYYRGYDTLFETTVVATAGFCLILLLRVRNKKLGTLDSQKNGVTAMNKKTHASIGVKPNETFPDILDQDRDIIMKTVTKFLIPFIQLFGLYVIVHGDMSPGGGFQGGVILGVSIIIYSLVFGFEEAKKRMMSVKTKDLLISTGVLVYGGIGVIALFLGGNYLQYGVLMPDPQFGSIVGIMGIEIGVGITVAAVMITLFYETVRIDAND